MLLSSGSIEINLEDQVCSLPLAKKLKDLVVKQESFAYWSKRQMYIVDNYHLRYCNDEDCHSRLFSSSDNISAFTVAELISMLIEIFGHDIMIPNNVVVADFLAEKIIGFHEACSKKD